jgi:hypothetical protein
MACLVFAIQYAALRHELTPYLLPSLVFAIQYAALRQ